MLICLLNRAASSQLGGQYPSDAVTSSGPSITVPYRWLSIAAPTGPAFLQAWAPVHPTHPLCGLLEVGERSCPATRSADVEDNKLRRARSKTGATGCRTRRIPCAPRGTDGVEATTARQQVATSATACLRAMLALYEQSAGALSYRMTSSWRMSRRLRLGRRRASSR